MTPALSSDSKLYPTRTKATTTFPRLLWILGLLKSAGKAGVDFVWKLWTFPRARGESHRYSKTGCYYSDCCWPNCTYTRQTVDEDGLHTEIVAVVILVVAMVSTNWDPKERQTYQPLCICSIWSQRDSPYHVQLCLLTKTNFPVRS